MTAGPAAGTGALPAGGVMRVMGSETEYGIHAPSAPGANATMMSARVIQAYAQVTRQRAAGGAETRWDYTDEEPLHDARGWTVERAAADPEQLTDRPPVLDAESVALAYGRGELERDGEDESGSLLMNMVLGNGARLYVDHAHPEYSSPEVTNPHDAVVWDAAGDLVALAAVRRLAADPELPPINLYKNNTDNKSVSYGSHENYLMPRSTPFGDIVRGLTPFFITRQVMCGAGRVGLGQDSSRAGYQISQRADFFETEVGLETTIRRPIINNTRDEPHATADKYRRLHVIIGDANLSEAANYLKFGTTAAVLSLIEAGLAPRIEVHDPVAALQSVSHDTALTATLRLKDGRRVTALDIQWMYHEAASKLAQETGVGDAVDGDGHTRAAGPVGCDADRARWRPGGGRVLRGMAGQAVPAGGLPAAGRAGLVRCPVGPGGPAVGGHPPREGPLPPAPRPRPDATGCHGGGDPTRRRRAAVGHPGLFPRPLRQPLRARPGRCQLGFGDLRPPRPGQAAARPHPRTAARNRGPDRRFVRPAPGRRGVPGRAAGPGAGLLTPKPPQGPAAWQYGLQEVPRRAGRTAKEKIMAGQEQMQPQSRDTEVEEDVTPPPAAPEAQASEATQGVDDLLDEIDGVLESNAEEFVRAFVQKGGQ